MTNPVNTLLQTVVAKTSDATVSRHDVTFQLKVTAFQGQPVSEDSPVYSALSTADEDLFSRLPHEIEGWRYRDHYQIECDRLDICQPEFGYDASLPDDVTLYDVTVTASHELPLLACDATQERPVSVEQLMNQVPAILLDVYGKAGVTLELHRVRFYKKYEYSSDGEYARR